MIKAYREEIPNLKLGQSHWDQIVDNLHKTKKKQNFMYFAETLDSSIADKAGFVDTKLMYSDRHILHTLRDAKAPQMALSLDEFKKLPYKNRRPDRIYQQDAQTFIFVSNINYDRVTATIFRQAKDCSLQLVTAEKIPLINIESRKIKRIF